jgi:hypothetical protein
MRKLHTFHSRLVAYGAIASVLLSAACNSSRVAQMNHSQFPAQTNEGSNNFAASQSTVNEHISNVSPSVNYEELVASNSDDMSLLPAAAGTNSLALPAEETHAKAEVVTPAKQIKTSKLKTLPAKILLKAALKKAEKAEKKRDIKNEKSAKAGKALDPDIRTGILIGALGLILIIIGAAVASPLLYTLGGIGLTVGLVVIILAALEVI